MTQLLIRTPDPFEGESLFGYVLRIAEVNGYETSWHVLRHAGYTQQDMFKAAFDVDKLAASLGKDPAALAHMTFRSDGEETLYRLRGQALGRAPSTSSLRLRCPAVCPECIKEKEFAPAAWDSKVVVACAKHRRYLVDRCPACSHTLSWYRPGVLTCRCGASLTDVTPVEAPAHVTALARLLTCKIDGEIMSEAGDACGLPLEHLGRVSLAATLSVIRALQAGGTESGPDPSGVHVAAQALCNWPAGFHEHLRYVGRKDQAKPPTIGLCKRFRRLYRSLRIIQRQDEGVAFMRDELVRFGLTEWGEGFVDQKALQGVSAEARYVSAAAFAASIGARRVTVARWVAKGALPANTVSFGRQRRVVADLRLSDGVIRGPAGKLQEREAGRILRMPCSVLRQLKRSGHYSESPVANIRVGFWRHDLDELNRRLVNLPTGAGDAAKREAGAHVKLGDVLDRWKFGSKEAKGRLLAALLEGTVAPVKTQGKNWWGISLQVVDVEAFREGVALNQASGQITDSAAAKLLKVEPTVVAGLAAAGHVQRVQRTKGLAGVTRESVESFAQRWSPLVVDARALGTNAKGLAARCERLGLRVLWVPRPVTGAKAPFVWRDHREALVASARAGAPES